MMNVDNPACPAGTSGGGQGMMNNEVGTRYRDLGNVDFLRICKEKQSSNRALYQKSL